MTGAEPGLKIVICMGSSCFARGNNRNLEVIREYLGAHGIEASVELQGSLCLGECQQGPNLLINGTLFSHVDPNVCLDLLRQHLAAAPGPT
jgi:NADH:ubiquinone oxidoreductase subunit E